MRRFGLDLPLAWRVYAAFFLYAFAMGGIFPRLPEIQRAWAWLKARSGWR